MADARARRVEPTAPDIATATLFDAYRHYAFVKYCNEIRQGYASVYVNDIELDRARAKIKAIEASYVAANKDLDTDALFSKAASSLKGMNVSAQTCHMVLFELFSKYPTRNGNIVIEKDF